jgi:membrane protein DedA with SNARE-associated domain
MEEYVRTVTNFVAAHQAWAVPVVFVLAFGESLAFVSLIVPAWGALVAIGALIEPSGLSFWPIWLAGSLGAAVGDWLSYWIGFRFKHTIVRVWPLSRTPALIPRGERFLARWGVPGIFLSRFSGPLRAAVPLAAGIFAMPYGRFQAANVVSAFVWCAVLLQSGDLLSKGILRILG